MNEEDYLGYEEGNEYTQIDEQQLESTLKKWCDEAYELLQEEGLRISNEADRAQALLALRRMLGLFIEQEEYEKCTLVKQILEKNYKTNSDLTPLFDYRTL